MSVIALLSLVRAPGKGQVSRISRAIDLETGKVVWHSGGRGANISIPQAVSKGWMEHMLPESQFTLIFANGVLEATTWLEPYLQRARTVIAADGGLRHLLALGRMPDVLLGDLDSLPEGAEGALASGDFDIVRFPRAKDETDLELALLYAIERFPNDALLIAGGLGGRLDHSLANIMLLAHPAFIGRPIYFIEKDQTAWLIKDETVISGGPGDIVSLIPLAGDVKVAETTGLRWHLFDETLTFGPARGMSNEMTTGEARIRIETGLLFCVHISAGE